MKINLTKRSLFQVILIIILIPVVLYLHYRFVIRGLDWVSAFRPAALAVLDGKSPYGDLGTGYEFYNPPWALIPFLPIALLPPKAGNAVFFLIALISYFITAHQLKARLLQTLLFIFSLPVLYDLISGNIAWLVMLGYILPPPVGLFFVLIKPQIGGIVALYWFVEAWREGGIIRVIKTFLPVTIAFALSFIIYGFWIAKLPSLTSSIANSSLFPLSIPIGLVLMMLALRNREIKFAYMASPFISPYVIMNSYGTVLLGLINSTWEMFTAWIGFWIAQIFILRSK